MRKNFFTVDELFGRTNVKDAYDASIMLISGRLIGTGYEFAHEFYQKKMKNSLFIPAAGQINPSRTLHPDQAVLAAIVKSGFRSKLFSKKP